VRSDIVVRLPIFIEDKLFNSGLPYSPLHLNFLGQTFMKFLHPIYSTNLLRVLSRTIW
jgi:hypothetical protein